MPQITRKPISDKLLQFIESAEADSLSPQEILTWSLKNFQPRIALSCSFGAPEGLVLLDMMHRIDPASRVFVIDTGRLPQETHDLIDRVRARYDKPVEVVFPRSDDVESMLRDHGTNLFYESIERRQLCCGIRKVEPLKRVLTDLDAWVTGLRRDQNVTRHSTPKVQIDYVHGGIVKVNPIADWSRDQVASYVAAYDVPTNRLHAQGYPSVGCAPCSRAVAPGADLRSGRWWWEQAETRECGIHTGEEEQGSGI
jgi:thioredoxin-dependent adenylylsulfate APS reductase